MRIATRAGLGFGVVALFVFLLGAFALSRITVMEDEAEHVDQQLLPTIQLLGQINQRFLMIRAGTLRLLIVEPGERNAEAAGLDAVRKTLAEERQELDRLITSVEGKALLAAFDQSLARYEGFQRKMVELTLEGRVDEAISLTRGELNEHALKTSQAVADLIDLNRKAANAASAHALDVADNAFQGVVVAIILALIATVVLAMLLTRSIVQPLAEAVSVAEIIAGGDLTRGIKIVGNDEPARLLVALQAMQQSLRDTIQGISHSSNQLASAAEELNVVTEDSTRGLHQQNHEIEQAATAVNEMTTAVDEVARNAVATSEASRESDETAQHGRQQVIRTVESIDLLAGDVTQTATEVERLAGQVRDISK
ncbi:MAG TPA: methyl-accepting chemotaxis protein, partial [Pseudomonas sp.]|nr:methyl-accepting chemotaxis protein [Pseudomonas sp.]